MAAKGSGSGKGGSAGKGAGAGNGKPSARGKGKAVGGSSGGVARGKSAGAAGKGAGAGKGKPAGKGKAVGGSSGGVARGRATGGSAGGARGRAAQPAGRGGQVRAGQPRGAAPRGAAPRGAAARGGAPRGPASRSRSEQLDPRGHRDEDRGLGGSQIEGRNAVIELLRARKRKVREIWIVEESEYSDAIEEIRELAREQKVSVRPVAAGRLQREAHSESPQGVLARAAEIEPVTLVELAKKVKGVEPFLVVLDGLTDPHNVGAVMRSAALAGATGIVLPRHRSANITPTVAKAAAGAIEYLPMALVGGVANALKELADNGVWSLGLDANGETSLFSDDVTRFATGSVAVVVGAEGSGLSSLVRRRCDVVVSIPQTAVIDSLNASVAAGVACFDIARRRALA